MLVLDDLHAIANPACLDVLAALCEHVPAGSLIATASREEPSLPLARWRTQGRLHEVGVADLRLDQQEAAALLSGAGVELDPTGVADLTERTEGWPAGLYLAALSLQAGAPDPAPAMVFAGDDRLVSEYFRLEILSRLPEAEARFLTHTSVLERMCGRLCDAVLETTRSAVSLESLVRSNSFVVPLDRRGEWYRYHHLFGELLRSELERREPETVATLNARAMAWCVDNDLLEAAVLYGQAAGETAVVAGLVDRLALSLHYGGRLETLEQWLEWFDDDDLVRFPAIAVFGAWARALTGRSAEAQRWLSLADGATSAIPLSDGSATIEPWVATLRAAMMADGVERALADAERALELLPPGSDWRATALCVRGIAQALLGAADRARADLAATVDAAQASGAVEECYIAQAQLALLAARQAAWDEAGRQARRAQALVEETGLGDYSTSAIAHVAAARVALHDGRQADARAALTRAHRLRPLLDHSFPWLAVGVGLELTRAHLALGEVPAARTVFSEAEEVLALRPDLGSLVEEARELRERLAATSGSANTWAMSLTGAELAAASVSGHPSHVPGDRRAPVHLAQHGQDRGARDLPQAGCVLARQGDRPCGRGRAPGELDLPAADGCHPGWMRRREAAAGDNGTRAMDDYKEHLRRLAVHDDALVDAIAIEASSLAASVLDERTTSLVRIAAIVAVDAALASFQHAVAHALAVGATRDEVVATLEAVTPVTGAARVVSSAPKLALALGYDVEAALEQLDP